MMKPDGKEYSKDERADFRMYHELQYDRIAQLEQQRLTMTNVVIGVSTATFAVEFSETLGLGVQARVFMSLALIAINLFALFYVWKSREFIKMHQDRAELARAKYAPELNNLSAAVGKKDSDRDLLNRARLQQYVHIAMITIAILALCG